MAVLADFADQRGLAAAQRNPANHIAARTAGCLESIVGQPDGMHRFNGNGIGKPLGKIVFCKLRIRHGGLDVDTKRA